MEGVCMATKRHSRGISRRSFVQGGLAATLAAGSSLWLEKSPVAHADEPSKVPEEQVFSGVCRGDCFGGCHLNVYVRDGKIVRTSARELPEKAWTRICAKGLAHVFRVYDPNRAKYPMRRVGERGEGKWEQISWDEALTEIADKFTSYAQEFGPSSVAFHMGIGNSGFVDNMTRLQNTIGASTLAAPIDAAPFFSTNLVVGESLNFNGNEMTDIKNAKTIVIWGSNPAVSQIQGMHFIEEAHEQGPKVICIDPVYTATVSKCDQWIPVAAGTDGLLAIAVMNVILREGWEDTDFVRHSTVAPFLVKDDGSYLMMSDLGRADAGSDADVQVVTDGQGNFGSPSDIADPVYQGSFDYNGTHVRCAWELLLERLSQYSIDDASRICNIPEDVIEGLGYDIAVNKPATLYVMLGIDHYVNGFYSLLDMACITALTGNIGKPGAFCGISEFIPFMFGNMKGQYGPIPPNPQVSKVAVPVFAAKEAIDKGQWLGQPYSLKALWVTDRNLLQNLCDREYDLSWLDEVPFVVVSEVTMNEMGRYADIFLPVCHWFECEDVGHECPQNVFLEYNEKAIDPLYETKSDFDIVKALAAKMGYGDEFDFSVDDYLREFLNSDALRASGFDFDELKRRKAMRASRKRGPPVHPRGGRDPHADGTRSVLHRAVEASAELPARAEA